MFQNHTSGGAARSRSSSSVACVALFVAALVGVSSPAAAQCTATQTEEGINICGYVLTDTGEAVNGAVVTATGDGYGTSTTDTSGFYAISVGPGTWTVTVDASTIPDGTEVSGPQTVEILSDSDVHANVNFVVSSGSSGGEPIRVSGFVWNDENNNGIQDLGEAGIGGVSVYFFDGTDTLSTTTEPDGTYAYSLEPGTYQIYVNTTLLPAGTQASPANVAMNTRDLEDSDGVDSGTGWSVVGVTLVTDTTLDFGFYTPPVAWPGTGTPGYWKNHPAAWPVSSIVVGGVTYTKAQAITWLGKVGKDKTTTMFSSLVPAMLNVLIGNPDSCVATTIAAADQWMATYGPVGKNVAASSAAWAVGEPLHQQMDAYNNGLLCAPHRK